MSRPLTVTAVAVGALLLAIGVGVWIVTDDNADRPSHQLEARPSLSSFFYIHEAGSGSISDGDPQELILRDTADVVHYFSDRPRRVAGRTSLERFVDDWTSIFGEDPPNAAVMFGSGDRPGDTVVEVDQPDYDPRNATLVYRLRPIGSKAREQARQLEKVSVVVDPGQAPSASDEPGQIPVGTPIDLQPPPWEGWLHVLPPGQDPRR